MSSAVLEMLRKDSGDSTYHPLTSLLMLAREPDATIGDQITIHKSIARYVEAERKAIEIDTSAMDPVNFKFQIG